MPPPRVDRATFSYAAKFCEENVWQLAQDSRLPSGLRWAVFISNARRQCPLWQQRASEEPSAPVVWDYHVVLLVQPEHRRPEIWDLDTRLDFPCDARRYLEETFPLAGRLRPELEPRFRLVPRDELLASFASDRSHMLDADGRYQAELPAWPAIRTATETMNLSRFVDMTHDGPGRVLALDALLAFIAAQENG